MPDNIETLSEEDAKKVLAKLPTGSMCAFSQHPRLFSAWDMVKKVMYPPKTLTELCVTLTAEGRVAFAKEKMNLIVRWFTGFVDTKGRMIFEGDVCEGFAENSFGSLEKVKLIAIYDEKFGCFCLKTKLSTSEREAPVKDVVYIGNEIENPELMDFLKE